VSEAPDLAPPKGAARSDGAVTVVLFAAVCAVLALGGFLVWRAESRVNKVSLSQTPKPVTVIRAVATPFQPSRTYVGALESWLSANVGPQLVSGYVDTVLVRPGAIVKRGEVLATIDCRDASAERQATAMQARAIDTRQRALAAESARVQTLLDGSFVSPDQAQRKAADSTAEAAELDAMKANLARGGLSVDDCVLRAPFDGEVATRVMDPGAFVRPGMTIVSVVDRSTIRLSADVPEIDFAAVHPGTEVRVTISATKRELHATVSRRAPAADPSTRTVHFEVDLPDPDRRIPVGTTGEVHLRVGTPEPATEIPLFAAAARGNKATIFVLDGDVARSRTVAVKGELGGSLFVEASLAAGTRVVTEGRALLADGDHVDAHLDEGPGPTASSEPERRP
jgi:RND family efflux transporter MFP subunit